MSFLGECEHLILISEPDCVWCCMHGWETFTRRDKHKTCMYYSKGNLFRSKQRLIKLNNTLSWRVYAVWSYFGCNTSKTSYILGHWRCVAPIVSADFIIILLAVNKRVGRFVSAVGEQISNSIAPQTDTYHLVLRFQTFIWILMLYSNSHLVSNYRI